MQVTEHVHALRIPFQIRAPTGTAIERFVYVYLIYGQTICLIDTGVAGSEHAIFEYLRSMGRTPEEITTLVLTHAHPDHIGAARAIKEISGCTVAAHRADQPWIEKIEQQFRDRPIPNFQALVGGSVAVDRALEEGNVLELEEDLRLDVLHTPGHSRGSISLWLARDRALFSGDAVPLPGEVPIYEDAVASARSIVRLRALAGIRVLLSSWDEPRTGEQAYQALDEGLAYLQRVHETVITVAEHNPHLNPRGLCAPVLEALGLPTSSANPLIARSVEAHLAVRDYRDLLTLAR
jgi:glyoxylase-like metal-dependent hydrolase (beta-lactamase superfamily II)